jgi:hypothetical protein
VVGHVDEPFHVTAMGRSAPIGADWAGGQGEARPGARRVAGLLGFLEPELTRTILARNPYSIDVPAGMAYGMLSRAAQAVADLPPDSPRGKVSPLPDELLTMADRLRNEDVFRTHYSTLGYDFGLVNIADLMTPQFDADLDYVLDLATGLALDLDLQGAFALAFRDTSVCDPVSMGNHVVFASRRRDLLCDAAPVVTRIKTQAIQLSVIVESRPNYIQVAVLESGQLVVANGIHRLLAMALSGIASVPCLWRCVRGLEEIGIASDGTAKIMTQLATRGPRPALVTDYLDEALAVPMLVPSMDLVLRVTIGTELFTVPTARG